MANLTHTLLTTRFIYLAFLTSIVTALLIQRVEAAPILVLCILPWLIILFYNFPMLLVILWYILLLPTLILPDIMIHIGPIYFLPLDPAYFFSIVYIFIASLYRPKDFFSSFRENPFLFIFLFMLIFYILVYTPVYGKSAIGEGRKVYFMFFFPVLVSLYVKIHEQLRQLLTATFFLSAILIVVSILRLITGSPLRSIANSNMALIFQLNLFSILIFHLNKSIIITRTIDILILSLSLCILLLTQHRSVILTGGLGVLLLIWIYRNQAKILLKAVIACIAFLVMVGVIMTSSPSFEHMTVNYIKGILDPRSDRTASWRMEGWNQQMRALSTIELLFGEGLGNYYIWYVKGKAIRFEPHNGYIQIILKFGILGLVIYAMLALKFFKTLGSMRRGLEPGFPRAFIEMSIVNFGAAHAYMMGYGFSLIMLVFYALGMNAARQTSKSRSFARQHGSLNLTKIE